MALNMPVPGENALQIIAHRKKVADYVANNKEAIRQLYFRVSGAKVSKDKLVQMANANPETIAELEAMKTADAFRSAHEGYYGEAKPFESKKFKKDQGATNRSAINAAIKFYGNLAKKHDTPQEYNNFLDAKTKIDELSGTEQGKAAISAYGYDNLVKAEQGLQDYAPLKAKVDYFTGLDSVIRKYMNRGATTADVEALMPKYATPDDYGKYLSLGSAAGALSSTIGTEDLSGWGAGGITQQALQDELYQQGPGGDLQRRIEEARVKRKNAFTGAQSQAYGSLTEGGNFKQNLF